MFPGGIWAKNVVTNLSTVKVQKPSEGRALKEEIGTLGLLLMANNVTPAPFLLCFPVTMEQTDLLCHHYHHNVMCHHRPEIAGLSDRGLIPLRPSAKIS